MPLTNPDKVVTEERLAEFYQQILPYMGGMPDVMMSKFSKSDIYSLEERMIGVWTDGKPLYKRTFQFTSGGANWVTIDANGDHSNWGYSFVTDYAINTSSDGAFMGGNQTYGVLIHTPTSLKNDFSIHCPSWSSGSTGYVTVCYTKTTDSPVVVGDADDYSTTEKIVGTWIDGKPVWQKTFYTTSTTTGSEVDISYDANIDTVVNIEGLFHRTDNSTSRWLPMNCYTQSNMYGFICYDMSGKSIKYKLTGYSTDKQIITIQYTKTSS